MPLFIKDKFTDFYRDLDCAVARSGGTSVFLEYAWDTGSCDPCSAPPPTESELTTFGANWTPDSMREGRFGRSSGTFLDQTAVRV